MPLKVIGAGFGRTGTNSLRVALNMLGLGPCHHMHEVISNPVQKLRWRALGRGAAPDWEALFEGYHSCVDWPATFYWRELAALYTEAKVILTWRPADEWWTSFESTILKSIGGLDGDPDAVGRTIVAAQALEGRPGDRDHVIALYEANVAAVKAQIAPERLLVFRAQDGWGPLCAFLGVPVPDAPYPRLNSAAEYTRAR